MTEDGFNLSAHDVRHQEFHKSMRGYDPVQVDDFKERIAQELDRLWRDRSQSNDRLQNMVEQLKVFRDRERAMNDDLILSRARAQAEQQLAEAKATAQQIMAQANQEEQRLYHANDAVRRQFVSYATSYRRLLERELSDLEALTATEGQTPTDLHLNAAVRRPA